MHILALEPYYGGSHKAFLDGLIRHSRHQWTKVTLPPYKWKWRMRHAAVTMAEMVGNLRDEGVEFDLVFCSDMLNLAEFKGLVSPAIGRLPSIIYFHENQLTYPVRKESERDMHFPFSNFTSCLAAEQIWFNSQFHLAQFFENLPMFLERMPDYQPTHLVSKIRSRSQVIYPGLEMISPPEVTDPGLPVHILWAARWEHDKNPQLFFDALAILQSENIPFRVSVIGEQFEDSPVIFDEMRAGLGDRIARWGFLPSREEYINALQTADIVVSTADHEFYGLAVLEAVSAGAYPVLPNRLSYPELIRYLTLDNGHKYLYEGSLDSLVARLRVLLSEESRHYYSQALREERSRGIAQYRWVNVIQDIDSQLDRSRERRLS